MQANNKQITKRFFSTATTTTTTTTTINGKGKRKKRKGKREKDKGKMERIEKGKAKFIEFAQPKLVNK